MKNIFGLSLYVLICAGCMKVTDKTRPKDQQTAELATVMNDSGSDIQVEGLHQLAENQSLAADRITIKSNAVLWLSDKKLELKAKEVIFEDGAFIGFYPSDQIAPFRTQGKNAGVVLVNATTIVGQGHFSLSGQTGGEGWHGGQFFLPKLGDMAREVIECPPLLGYSGGSGGVLVLNTEDYSKFKVIVEQWKASIGPQGKAYNEEGYQSQKSSADKRFCRNQESAPTSGSIGLVCTRADSFKNPDCAQFF